MASSQRRSGVNKARVLVAIFLLLGSRSVVAQELSICNEAKLAKKMRGKYANYRVVNIEVLFGEGHGAPVIVDDGKGDSIPVTVNVLTYDGKKTCLVDPTHLSYQWQYSSDGPSVEAGIRVEGPGRFSFPARSCLVCGLSLAVTHAVLGHETKRIFEPVLVWTAEQFKLNKLENSLHRVLRPDYDPLLDAPQPELTYISLAINRAIESLYDARFDEALIEVQEVRDRIGTLPGGVIWRPALDSVDDILAGIRARKSHPNGGEDAAFDSNAPPPNTSLERTRER
jgi:hypothetical protein